MLPPFYDHSTVVLLSFHFLSINVVFHGGPPDDLDSGVGYKLSRSVVMGKGSEKIAETLIQESSEGKLSQQRTLTESFCFC